MEEARALPRRIVMVVANNLPTDARVLKEAKGLVAQGCDVTVIGYEKTGWRYREVHDGGLHLLICPFAGAQIPGIGGKLLRYVVTLLTFVRFAIRLLLTPADVIHVHDPHPLPIGWLAAKLRGARLVYDAHECFAVHSSARGLPVLALVERLFIRSADRIINVGDELAQKLEEKFPGLGPQIVVANYPEAPRGELAGVVRARAGLAPNDCAVLYAGGFFLHNRRLDNIVRALTLLPGQVHAVFLGYDSRGAIAKLRALAHELGVADRVSILDAVPPDTLVSAISDANVGLLPLEIIDEDTYYSVPNKLFEYLAAGVPVVGTRIAHSVLLEKEGYGVLLESPPTPERLAAAIRTALADPALPQRTREGGPALVRARFSWESQLVKLVEMYRGLAR